MDADAGVFDDEQNDVAAVRFKHALHFEQRSRPRLGGSAPNAPTSSRFSPDSPPARKTSAPSGGRSPRRSPAKRPTFTFGAGATIPLRRPSEPHLGIANFVPMDDWPAWFHECVRLAANQANRAPREEVSA
jgi:hypothetical protein